MEERVRNTGINESLFRTVINQIERLSEDLDARSWALEHGRVEFHCECGRNGCNARVALTVGEYERVRAQDDRFALTPGHETPELERVIERNERFVVVDKLPEAEPLVGSDGVPGSDSEASPTRPAETDAARRP